MKRLNYHFVKGVSLKKQQRWEQNPTPREDNKKENDLLTHTEWQSKCNKGKEFLHYAGTFCITYIPTVC